jgi:hypothetical protein
MYLNLMLAGMVLVAIVTFLIDHNNCKTVQSAARDYWSRKRQVDYPVLGGAILVSFMLVFAIYSLGTAGMLADTETLNGKVVKKESDKVHCRHSYDCNCRNVRSCSGSGKNSSCSTTRVCDTCYEHSFDVDWNVFASIGSYSIDTIDRQGLREPPRWTQTLIGEPVAIQRSYRNPIKASPQSIFNSAAHTLVEFKGKLPPHPGGIYDYWHTNRLVLNGVALDGNEQKKWNDGIAEILKDIGITKQVNLVVVMTNSSNSLWANALQTEWIGGKKNEVVLVMGVKNYPEIEWVHVFSWSETDLFNVKLRDAVKDLKMVDRDIVLRISYENIMAHFKRKSMKNYDYLESEIEPESWFFILAIILGISPFGVYLFRFKFI